MAYRLGKSAKAAYDRANYLKKRLLINARNAEWKRLNPEKNSTINKEWSERNREKLNAASVARYKLNPKKATERQRRFKESNPERVAEIQRNWRKRNPHKLKDSAYRKRARKKAATIRPCEKTIAAIKRMRKCYWCGNKGKMTVDHVIALADGGAHDPSNLVPCCGPCNHRKNARSVLSFTQNDTTIKQLAFA